MRNKSRSKDFKLEPVTDVTEGNSVLQKFVTLPDFQIRVGHKTEIL